MLDTQPQTISRRVLPLLAAQAVCVGFTVALLFAVGNTVFIVANGADSIPYAYLWACFLTSPLSLIYNRLQRVWSVSQLNIATVALFFALHILAWWLARSTRLDLSGYILYVGYTLAFAFLAIVISTQANRLYSARQMQSQFPIILAIQTTGVIAAGLFVASLGRLLGGELQLLGIGAGVMLLLAVILVLTSHHFPLLTKPQQHVNLIPVKIEQLVRQRLPRLLLAYQFFSSLGTLLLMYLLTVLAERVFESSDSLTQFFGYLIAGATFGTLVFLLFGSARLLRSRGVGFGLVANPAGVIGLVAILLFGHVFYSSLTFVLLVIAATARTVDFILSVGTTETSVNAFIKQLPGNTQLSLITAINAIAYPLSYGVAGMLVLAAQQWVGVSLTPVLIATLAICMIWLAVSIRISSFAE